MPPKANGKAPRKAANGYRLPDPLPEGEVIRSVHQKKEWKLGKSIGVGGFGEIYLCVPGPTSSRVGDDAPLAVKIEPHENGPLFVEMNFYIRAAQEDSVEAFRKSRKMPSLGMPVLRGSGSHIHRGEKYRFLVMDRYGKDIQKVFQNGKRTFSVKVAFTLAVKIVDVLEYIHSKGYVHNDIKAQNLLLGHGRHAENDVYLVDFGLVSKYQREGVHLEYKPDARKAHDGTIEYTSRDAHIGAHSRRSDLEILGYNLVHWMSGTLPWLDRLTDQKYVQAQKNGYMKDIPSLLRKCFGNDVEYPAELETFLVYVSKLDFDTEPDYNKCRTMFTAGLKKRKIPADGKIDFSAAAKSPPLKKVRKSSSSSSPRKAATPKRSAKRVVESSDEEDEEEEEVVSPVKKKPPSSKKKQAASAAKKKGATSAASPAAKRPKYKDSASQTSPGFVKMAKAARAKQKAEEAKNKEMDEFVDKATKAAVKANGRAAKTTPKKAATPKATPKKSPRRAKASDGDHDGVGNGVSNPTPTMLALMKKRAEKEAAASAGKRRRAAK